MKQWWLVMALLLSVGINIGILLGRDRSGRAPVGEPVPSGDAVARVGDVSPGPPAGARRDRAPRFIYRLADELRLEGEAREAFIARQRRFLEETLAARTRFAELQGTLRRELLGPEANRDEADALLDELGTAHAQIERAFVENLFDVRELLSPGQQRRYLRFLGRFRQARDSQGLRRLREELQGRGGPPGRRWMDRGRPGSRQRPEQEAPPERP